VKRRQILLAGLQHLSPPDLDRAKQHLAAADGTSLAVGGFSHLSCRVVRNDLICSYRWSNGATPPVTYSAEFNLGSYSDLIAILCERAFVSAFHRPV